MTHPQRINASGNGSYFTTTVDQPLNRETFSNASVTTMRAPPPRLSLSITCASSVTVTVAVTATAIATVLWAVRVGGDDGGIRPQHYIYAYIIESRLIMSGSDT